MSIPVIRKSIVGRRRELAAVGQLLDRTDVSLITLTGMGGVGKTTIAIVAADHAARGFEDGVCFVALAPLTDPDDVPAAIGAARGLPENIARPTIESLIAEFKHRRLLLVLDNLEHLWPARMIVSQLLAECPGLVVLVTSRIRLRLDGEHVLTIRPLSLPRAEQANIETMRGNDAALLFAERAVAARPDFALSERNVAAVAEICRELDGIPLAIELAAARLRSIGVSDLLSIVRSRISLASGGPDDRAKRQQSLAATVDWSVRQLSPCAQHVFATMSLLPGGFTADAAIAVAFDDSPANPEARMLDILDELVENHVITVEDRGTSTRYTMLATVREVGVGRLEAMGLVEATHRRHVAYALEVSARAERDFRAGRTTSWVDRLDDERENARGVLRWLLAGDDADKRTAMDLAGNLWQFWQIRGYWREAAMWLRACADASDVHSTSLARVWLYLGHSLFDDHLEARRCYERSLQVFTDLDDPGGVSVAIGALAMLCDATGAYDDGIRLATEAMDRLSAAQGDVRSSFALMCLSIADLQMNGGSLSLARSSAERALAIWREIDNDRFVAAALTRLGRIERLLRNPIVARAFLTQAIATFTRLGDQNLLYVAQVELGFALHGIGDTTGARQAWLDAIEIARSLDLQDGIVARALEGLAISALGAGNGRGAAKLLAAADRVRERTGVPVPQVEQADVRRVRAEVRRRLGPRLFAAKMLVGGSFSQDQIWALASEMTTLSEERAAVPARPGTFAELSPREVEVMCEIVKGRSDREIGEVLLVKTSTARTFVQRIRTKLGASNRHEVVAIAMRQGWCKD